MGFGFWVLVWIPSSYLSFCLAPRRVHFALGPRFLVLLLLDVRVAVDPHLNLTLSLAPLILHLKGTVRIRKQTGKCNIVFRVISKT